MPCLNSNRFIIMDVSNYAIVREHTAPAKFASGEAIFEAGGVSRAKIIICNIEYSK